MVSIRNNITTPPNHVFCAYTPDRSLVMRITNMVTSLMKDTFKINDLASFNVLYDIQHGDPETIKSERLIYVTAVDIYWAQIIFQYSHELCHLLIEEPIPEQFKWFEESLCDLASIYFLHESEENWPSFFPDQPDYQEKIRKYIFNLSPGEKFPLKELFDNQSEHSTYMKMHRYDRDKNRYIAHSLFTIFKGSPQLWKSVPLLCSASNAKSFKDFLHQWRNSSKDENIDQIIQLFV